MERVWIVVEKVMPTGAYLVSAIINGERRHLQYMGYTKQQAIRLFCERFKVRQRHK